jgi:peptide/nickel transport system permease protein
VTRIFDLLITLPPLLVVLVIVAGFGTSELVVILGVALAYTPRIGRIVRSATQSVVTNDYVAAAQARSENAAAICFREIVPNIAIPVTADLAMRITYAVLLVATLNFLGLGAQPPSANWGLMIAESRSLIQVTPWATIAPACGIAALSITFNLLADGLARHLTGMTYRETVNL